MASAIAGTRPLNTSPNNNFRKNINNLLFLSRLKRSLAAEDVERDRTTTASTRLEESSASPELPPQQPEHPLDEHEAQEKKREVAKGQEGEEAVGGQGDEVKYAYLQSCATPDYSRAQLMGKQMSSMGIKDVNRELKSRGIPKHEIENIKKERRKVKNCKYSKDSRVTVKDLDDLEKKLYPKIAQEKIEFEGLRIEHKILDVLLELLRHIKSKLEDPSWVKSEAQRYVDLITGFDRHLIEDFILKSQVVSSHANNETASESTSIVSGDLDTKGSPKRKRGGFKGVDPEEYLRQNLSQVWESSAVVLKYRIASKRND